MTFDFIFSREQERIIPAVLIDSRASIPQIKNQIGEVIKAYTDSQVSLVTATTIFYKVETEFGSLAGYFTLNVNTDNQSATLGQFVLRPAFVSFNTQITNQIINFVTGGSWRGDFLF